MSLNNSNKEVSLSLMTKAKLKLKKLDSNLNLLNTWEQYSPVLLYKVEDNLWSYWCIEDY